VAEISGDVDGRFESVSAVLSELIDSGEDVGASVAVLLEGRPVLDIWGGWADEQRTRLWTRDTLTNVWSTTKTMTALCALMLIDRGQLDPDEKVAAYWPEFAQNGKENVLVRHLLSHTSGVSGWAQPVEVADLYD
jgi:CubicO group peptidase (beta-lactamase class C family)